MASNSLLLTLACLVAALALQVNGSCIDTIEKILKKGARPMAGGWNGPLDMDDSSTVENLEALAQISATLYNEMSNDMRFYEPMVLKEGSPIVQEAYTQVVNGLNYCLRFTMQSTSCKNTHTKDAMCANKALVCDVQVYTPFTWSPSGNGPAPDVSLPMHCVPFNAKKSDNGSNNIIVN